MYHQIEFLGLVFTLYIIVLTLGFLDGGTNNFCLHVLIDPLCQCFTLCWKALPVKSLEMCDLSKSFKLKSVLKKCC